MAIFPGRQDRGVAASEVRIELEADGTPRRATVAISLDGGGPALVVVLERAEAAGALTAGERAAFQSGLPKLYAAAVAKAGGV